MAVYVGHQAVFKIIDKIVVCSIMLQGKTFVWGRARLIGAGIGQHDNHFLTVSRSDSVADNGLYLVVVQGVLIAENPMEQVQHRVFFAGAVSGWEDDLGLAG